jgi:hypothetical protein
MYTSLASMVQTIATYLLSASQALPVSQLSVVVWLMFAASRSMAARNSFNSAER